MVTVDVCVVKNISSKNILLIRRGNNPFKNLWAIPGGFIEMEEDLKDAAVRELFEETNIHLEKNQLTLLDVFGKPGRDPRGRLVTVVYFVELTCDSQNARAGDDASDAAWFDLNGELPELAFDHHKIIEQLKTRLKK